MSKPAGVLVETYRGCGIYWYSPGTWYTYAVYDSPCIPGVTFRSPQDLIKAIDDKLGPVPPPPPELKYLCPYCDAKFATEPELTAHIASAHPPAPPPPEEDTLIEVYRDVEIWLGATTNIYTAQVAPGYLAAGFTLEECRATIDDILEFLYPPEDPEEGLFAQIVAEVKAWFLVNIQPWVTQWGTVLNNWTTYIDESIDYWGDQVTQFIDNSITYVDDSIHYWGDQITQFIDESVHYVDESINYWGDQVIQNITNVLGASTEWVNEQLAGVGSYINDRLLNYAPQGFQSNPEEYVKTHAEDRFNLKVFEFVKSFWEGFEEGLEE